MTKLSECQGQCALVDVPRAMMLVDRIDTMRWIQRGLEYASAGHQPGVDIGGRSLGDVYQLHAEHKTLQLDKAEGLRLLARLEEDTLGELHHLGVHMPGEPMAGEDKG